MTKVVTIGWAAIAAALQQTRTSTNTHTHTHQSAHAQNTKKLLKLMLIVPDCQGERLPENRRQRLRREMIHRGFISV